MLKQRELHETADLYELLRHPSVFPYVRHKATSAEEYLFMTKQLIEEELNGITISRTIVDEWGAPIGTISIFDIQDGAGFLGTWLGKPFQGFGYNQKAKLAFLNELFFEHDFNTVFLRIRQENARSQAAALKLPYVVDAQYSNPGLYDQINQGETKFHLFKIPKDLFYLTTANTQNEEEEQAM
ncbi:N-acetyltransferase [Lysinibacillus sp. 2017]|uniref:GNAT family N-acetyltransferase n=1 Tax=unclassified Lysinibacillus TaxID=2636778 RepID=UPI000D529E31|nr:MULTISPECIES: GNAT family N-acetyltransferase [unclassified Lysinibacillus]AWE07452.1 N-acetyltransferase [Lysinibacillus sp. 2017]TGN36616.1 N-acetyltransferase [Lysinibacillus sp. S2017]